LSQKNPSQRRVSRVAQGVGPEFNPEYYKKKKKKKRKEEMLTIYWLNVQLKDSTYKK
jgi:hypothetical protein